MSTLPTLTAFMEQLKEPIPDALVTYLTKCREMSQIENRGLTPSPSLVSELQRAAEVLKRINGYSADTLELLSENADEVHRLIVAEFMPRDPEPHTTSIEAA